MGAFIDKLSLMQWLIIAVIVELIAQVSGQFIFKEKEEQDNVCNKYDSDIYFSVVQEASTDNKDDIQNENAPLYCRTARTHSAQFVIQLVAVGLRHGSSVNESALQYTEHIPRRYQHGTKGTENDTVSCSVPLLGLVEVEDDKAYHVSHRK